MSTAVNLKPRGQDRRSITDSDRKILLQLEEFMHKTGAKSDGVEWTPVPRELLRETAALIRRLRVVE